MVLAVVSIRIAIVVVVVRCYSSDFLPSLKYGGSKESKLHKQRFDEADNKRRVGSFDDLGTIGRGGNAHPNRSS